MFRHLFASAAILAAGTSIACAADLGTRHIAPTPYVAAPAFTWTGFYIGANAGYGWGSVDTTQNTMTTSGRLVGLPAGSFPSTTFGGADGKGDLDGFVGGAQVGYNYQLSNNVVLGAEADIQYMDFEAKNAFLGSAQGPYYQTRSRLDWSGTARLRAGYAFDRVLFYVTGGLALANARGDLNITGGTPAAPAGPTLSASQSKTLVGYALGAGIEYAVTNNISVKGEYLYLNYGKVNYVFDYGAGDSAGARVGVDASIVRAGVNYRF